MAGEQLGQRKDTWGTLAPWTKLFTAFKVALDPKKLLLAAAGIVAMWFGWWLLSVVFFSAARSTPPVWSENWISQYDGDKERAWKAFKQDRNSWNLLYEMAAPIPTSREEAVKAGAAFDVADIANTLDE